MLKWLPAPLVGIVTGAVIAAHLVAVFCLLIVPPMVLKVLSPHRGLKRRCNMAMSRVGHWWGAQLAIIFRLLHAPQWHIEGVENITPGRSYVLVCNHRNWADIMVLAAIMQDRIPFFRFFIKYELLWVPIIGVACWAMDCPFMKRPTRAEIERNPELADEDLRATREACEKLRGLPVTIVNYAEGTRFTAAKHLEQDSPYRYLLRPKSGGLAYVLNLMGDQFEALIDVTIVYPDIPRTGLWAFLCGRLHPMHVRVQQRAIPAELMQGDYRSDAEYRGHFQTWLNGIWQEKDEFIGSLY